VSDVPFDGWWLAANGRWYPPETHPAFNPPGPMAAPAGWFQDADGEWVPPHTRTAEVDLTETEEQPSSKPEGEPDRRWRPVLAAAWTLVVVVAGGIGIAIATSDDDSPARVDSETTIRPLLPPSTMSADETTTTVVDPGATTVPVDTTTTAPAVPGAP
jgi:hypothetical protein